MNHMNIVVPEAASYSEQHGLTFHPKRDWESYAQYCVGWNYLSIAKLQWLHHWSLGMDKYRIMYGWDWQTVYADDITIDCATLGITSPLIVQCWWWHHNWLCSAGNDITIDCAMLVMISQLTRQLWCTHVKVTSNSLDIDFIHDDFNSRSCKK